MNLHDTTIEKFRKHRKKPSRSPFETTRELNYLEIDDISLFNTREHDNNGFSFYFSKLYGKLKHSRMNQIFIGITLTKINVKLTADNIALADTIKIITTTGVYGVYDGVPDIEADTDTSTRLITSVLTKKQKPLLFHNIIQYLDDIYKTKKTRIDIKIESENIDYDTDIIYSLIFKCE